MTHRWRQQDGEALVDEAGETRRRRDEQFVEFAQSNAARLRRTAYLMCRDWHLAEDLVQISLTKLYLAWGRNGAPDVPLAYARRVLARTLLDHRRRPSSDEVSVDEPPRDMAAGDSTVDLRLTLVDALARLSPDDRIVVVLRYWDELGVEEVASLLGIRATGVKARSARALTRLRALVGESMLQA